METLPENHDFAFDVHITHTVLWLITLNLTTGVTEWFPTK